jgi:hypothetical protein
MTQTQDRGSGLALIERSEQAASRAGERLGRLAGLTGLRIQQLVHGWRDEADRMDEPAAPRGPASMAAHPAGERQAATARAEEVVDLLGQRASQWVLVNGLQARRALARLREDAEDLWVEARETRAGWHGRQKV